MPANLTPAYDKADRVYREATTDEERLVALREMLRAIPKHKGTEKMQADLKRRISQLRRTQGKKGPGRTHDPFHVPKSGAGQVVLIGPPNVGKSMLVAATTKAHVKVTEYPFATALPVPGMAHFEDAQIQLVDTPPITSDHVPPGLMGTIRSADVIGIVVDATGEALEQADMLLDLLDDRGMVLRSVSCDELDPTDPAQYCALLIANKADAASAEDVSVLSELYSGRLEVRPVSAAAGDGLDGLLRRLWELLSVIRVYTKKPGKSADQDKPFTLHVGATIEDLAREIHRDLPEKMKFARIWGEGRFDGQQVHRTETLRDKDVVELRE